MPTADERLVVQIIQTLSSGKMPIMGVDWWISDAVKDREAAASQRLCIQTAELRAEMNQRMATLTRSPENIDAMLEMAHRVQAVDQACVDWMNGVPDHWRFKTVGWEDKVPGGDYSRVEVFPGRVDLYPGFYISAVWNMVRTARLALASIAVRCAAWTCAPGDYRTTAEYATAARTCADIITDIIASVPCHLGWHLKRTDLMLKHDLGFACGEEDCMKGLAGYFLTWPLATLKSQDYATDAQRAWAAGRLRFIASDMGVRSAAVLADVRAPVRVEVHSGLANAMTCSSG